MNKLPNGWAEYKLKDIMNISSKRYNPNKDTKNYKCIELEHIESETGILNGHTNSKDIHSVKNVFEKGEVLYGKLRPYLKKFYLAKFDGVCSSEIWVLKGKKVINDFLYYFIQQDNFNYIANVSIGMIMPRADWSYMSEISFNIPPLDEQKRIASALSKIDAYLENTIKLIEEKERFKRGIAKKLLTCKEGENIPEARFKGFEDEWETKTLSSISNIKKGEQKNKLDLIADGKYPVLNGGMNFSGYCNSYNREANTITISEGGNAGYVNFIKEKFWSSGHCYTLHDLKIDKYFLYQCLKNSEKRLMKLQLGTALKNIRQSEIVEFELNIPKSIKEQEKIGEYLSLLDAEIDNLKKQKELIKEMKRGAMQKLLSGEVKLLE
ncbi:restriction endonuclease subunit S [Brachyspira aalborgi]|uniref:Restriction endonuclease subunit S n=1 Tax=Brachyspira aalborgi TaxID=29522 RepID=A0A5C8FNA3_9SPIR|nr:restriction endonuclease subunit S [Brachyspira aalborgi]TXJ51076.1 restriction endonuclease subunit S [Brachyspira aalborgi]